MVPGVMFIIIWDSGDFCSSQHTFWGCYCLCLLHPRPLLFTVLRAAPWLRGPEMGASPWYITSTTWAVPRLPQCSFVASRCWNQVAKGSQKAWGSWWESIGSPEETARSVSCNPVHASLSSPSLTGLLRSLAFSSGQTDSLTPGPQHSMRWGFT